LTYTDFKENNLKRHKELVHPGIEKTTKWLTEKYYFPDYQKLIQNIIKVTLLKQNKEIPN